jgi:hypothetical protein
VGGSITLVGLTNPIVFGAPVTLVATVTPATATGGRVTFYDGAAIIGASILFNGKANIVTLPVSAYPVVAPYAADNLPVSVTVGLT